MWEILPFFRGANSGSSFFVEPTFIGLNVPCFGLNVPCFGLNVRCFGLNVSCFWSERSLSGGE